MIPLISIQNKIELFPVKTVVAVAIYGSGFEIGWSSHESTSPKFHRRYPHGGDCVSRHAEMHVLKKLPRFADAKKIKLYVLRIRANGSYGMAKPCKFCQEQLKDRGFLPRNIRHTDWEGEWKRMDDWNFEQIKEPWDGISTLR